MDDHKTQIVSLSMHAHAQEFEVQWEAPLQLVNLSRQSVYFRRLCEPAFYDFSCCGGHVETYVVKVRQWFCPFRKRM